MSAEVRAGYKQTAVGLVPVDWNCERLGDVANIRSGIAKNSASVIVDPISVHYLRVANVQDGFLDLEEVSTIRIARSDLGRYLLLAGDVLMNEGGDKDKLGRGAVWNGDFAPCIHQNHVFAVRCGQRLDPDFLSLWTAGRVARQFFLLAGKQTTNLASISKTALDGLPVVVPPMREQVAIRTALGDFDKILEGLGRFMAKKRDIKQATIQQLLTGQTRLPGFDRAWSETTLGEHAIFRTGPFGSTLHKSDYTRDGIPVINPMHIVDGRIQPTPSMTITEEAATKLAEFRVQVGEVIIGRRGDMGRCAVIGRDESGWLCGTGSMIVRPKDADADFVQRVLSSPGVISQIEEASVGTTMVNLNQRTLARVKLSLPPRDEQTAIAAVLSDMDAELTALEARRDKTMSLKQAMMQELLTGNTRLV